MIRRLPMIALIALQPLAGCAGPEPERPLVQNEGGAPILVEVYESVGECVRAGRLTAAECEAGRREALGKHPAFAEKWNHPQLCEEEHGAGTCSSVTIDGSLWWFARPVAFLACFPEDGQCRSRRFAPVYQAAILGQYTGRDGGYVDYVANASALPPQRREVRKRVRRPIVI